MRNNPLQQFENVPIGIAELKSVYGNYAAIRNKICHLEQDEQLIRLRRGLYVVHPSVTQLLLTGELIANHIYTPSYVSMQSALRYYGLIPEAVYQYQSMTTKVAREFSNPVGRFVYYHSTVPYYSIGITQGSSNGKYFLIATPEKALCDLICYTPNLSLRSKKSLVTYLQDDLRLDWDRFLMFDASIISACLKYSKKQSILNNLLKILQS